MLTGLGNGSDISLAGSAPCWWAAASASRPVRTGPPPDGGASSGHGGAGLQPGVRYFFWRRELRALGVTVRLLTADGSAGPAALSPDGMEGVNYTHLLYLRAEAMLHAVLAALPHRWAVQL